MFFKIFIPPTGFRTDPAQFVENTRDLITCFPACVPPEDFLPPRGQPDQYYCCCCKTCSHYSYPYCDSCLNLKLSVVRTTDQSGSSILVAGKSFGPSDLIFEESLFNCHFELIDEVEVMRRYRIVNAMRSGPTHRLIRFMINNNNVPLFWDQNSRCGILSSITFSSKEVDCNCILERIVTDSTICVKLICSSDIVVGSTLIVHVRELF